jgi:hypothetical protein
MSYIINRYTCRLNQLNKTIGHLIGKGYLPIIGKGNENTTDRHRNYTEMEHVIKSHPNNMFALKLSSLGIDIDCKTAMVWSRNLMKTIKHNNSIVTIDAEFDYQHYKIVNMTDRLVYEYNNDVPVIYKTYQMYRNDSLDTLEYDLTRKRDYTIGVKLVRGAYYNNDNKTGNLYKNIEETHNNYNDGVELFINKHIEGDEMICATHNYDSIEHIKKLIDEKELENIAFAQLMGMSDNYSEELISNEYKVYKYVPYGDFRETIPYLMRRLYENYPMILKLFH